MAVATSANWPLSKTLCDANFLAAKGKPNMSAESVRFICVLLLWVLTSMTVSFFSIISNYCMFYLIHLLFFFVKDICCLIVCILNEFIFFNYRIKMLETCMEFFFCFFLNQILFRNLLEKCSKPNWCIKKHAKGLFKYDLTPKGGGGIKTLKKGRRFLM